ncbi:MAG: FlgD immunoglobulin-like domain containing protein [Candidatus Marinimicrobia bacterium]|nr:FlgD immunoglobulin-like domain containing protein [Candidatus Neomarinimicrobiota bacterium]
MFASEITQAPAVTIGGTLGTVTGSGTTWTAVRALTADDTEGAVTLSIDYLDLAGNAGAQTTAAMDGSVVAFDKTPPTFTTVSMVSNNANTAYAMVGDIVTVTMVASESTQSPDVIIGGTIATVTGSGTAWTAARTLTEDDTEGSITFSIDYFDLAGNAGAQTTAATDGSTVFFDKTAPSVDNITSPNENGIYIVGDTVSITISLNEIVQVTGVPMLQLETGDMDASADYHSGSGSNELTFHYIVSAGHFSGDLSYQSSNALILNDGMIQDLAGNEADLALGDPGSTMALSTNKNLEIDGILPAIIAVSSTVAESTYKIGDLIPIEVSFDDNVSVSGIPILILETGINDAEAIYASGSGQSTLIFNYIVENGDIASDLDYAGISALTSNGGSIIDENGNLANLNLPIPGSGASLSASNAIVIDGIMPTVNMLTSSASNGTYKIGDVLPLTAVFSEIVNVSGEPQLLLETGTENPAVADYSGGTGTAMLTFSYTVTAGDTTADLDYYGQDALILNSGSIQDSIGNSSDLLLFSPGDANSLSGNKDLVIDGIAPSVDWVSAITPDGIFKETALIELTIQFREPVNVSDGIPQLALETGPYNTFAEYFDGTGNKTLTFHYTVSAGDNSSDLDYESADALSLSGSAIRDGAGNEAELLLPAPGAAGSLSSNSNLVIDTEEPNTIFVFDYDYYNDTGWGATGQISGTVEDSISGVTRVEVHIRRTSDGSYFDGSDWSETEISLIPENIIEWSYDLSQEQLDNNQQYTVTAKSTDAAGNVETTAAADTFIYDLEAPVSVVQMDHSIYNELIWDIDSSITGTANDSISGIYSISLLIKNTSYNTWWSGEEWYGEPVWLDGAGGLNWFYSINNEYLMDGIEYHIFSQAQDHAGNIQPDSGFASFIYDISGPSKGQVQDGLGTLDDNWSNNTSTISAMWTGFVDSTTALSEYLVAIGSDSGGADIVNWVSVDLDTYYVNDELNLQHGVTYYFSVRARDAANNMSESAISNGITIDTVMPIIQGVFEGSSQNPGFQGVDSLLSILWSASDDLSGILSYSFAVGSAPGDTDAVSWVYDWLDTSVTVTEVNLQHATTYWGSVAAFDSAGNSSLLTGDGITIDLVPPEMGQVVDISDLNMLDDQAFTPSQTTLMASWSGFEDSLSGIASYEYAMVNMETFLVDWTTVGLDTFVIDSALILSDGQVYYTLIQAIDGVGNVSTTVGTNGIIVDLYGPVGNVVMDGDSTDIDRQNSLDSYSGAWDLFTDELSGLDGHEYALYDLTDSLYYRQWQFTGLDTSVILESLNFLENHTYELHVRGLDLVGNAGEIISSDGVLIDLAAPAVPGNLVGRFSSQRIELTWEPVLDDDFSHYRIYAGPDSSQIEPILDSEIALSEAFIPGFQDGETYYLSVSSLDIAGNESILSSGVNGIPQHAAITAVYPDTLTTIFRDDKVVKIQFSQPLLNSGYPALNSIVYENMNLAAAYSDSDTTLTLTLNETIASLDTITITIPGIVDWAGDTTNEKRLIFHTYLLGDYNHDFHIGVEDLAGFISGWNSQDTTYELGPVTGTVPHLIPQLNQTFDMRDAMTLKRMWDWSNLAPPVMAAYQSYIGPPLVLEQSGRKLLITLPDETMASEIVISYPDGILDMVQQTSAEQEDNDLRFYKSYSESRKILQANGYREPVMDGSERQLSFTVTSISENEIPLSLGYQLMGNSDIIVARGVVDMRFVPTPEEFALHQNFPNPFNPVTRIKYDLKEKSEVSIIIYDVTGREVKQLINAGQEAGYHSMLWNGRNSQGQNAGAGVYFYMIQANDFRQVRKMLLLK